jgi:hypothetical protein
MQTTYQLKADDLNNHFLQSIKVLFPDKVKAIAASDAESQQEALFSAMTRKAGPLAGRIKKATILMHHYQILLHAKNEVITGYSHFALPPGQ